MKLVFTKAASTKKKKKVDLLKHKEAGGKDKRGRLYIHLGFVVPKIFTGHDDSLQMAIFVGCVH